MAAEALDLHVAGLLEDREAVPPPSALDDVMNAPDAREAVAFLVDVYDRRAVVARHEA